MIAVWLLVLVVLGIALRAYVVRRGVTQYTPAQIDGLAGRGPGSPILLDVRTSKERVLGSIPGSLHIPLNELAARSDELKRHESREIICYCQTGSRSLRAAHLLHTLGFKAGNLKGGIAEWNFLHRSELTRKGKR